WTAIDALLGEARVGVEGRVVIDAACDIGVLLAMALGAGAYWAIGSRTPSACRTVQRVQALWGNTRLTILPAPLTADALRQEPIHARVRDSLTEAVVLHSFSSSADHARAIDPAALPWRILVHAVDAQSVSIAELERRYGCRVA